MPARASALRASLRTSLESLITATADRAAEDAVSGWQQHLAGAALLSQLVATAEADRSSDYLALALADLGVETENGPAPVSAAALATSTAELPAAAAALVRAWQDHVLKLVQAENVTKRSIARVVSFDHESLALVLMVGVLGPAPQAGHTSDSDGGAPDVTPAAAGPERLLSSLFGAGLLRDVTARARQDLSDRVAALLDLELARFTEIVDAAGVPDEAAATQLVAASEALEAAR